MPYLSQYIDADVFVEHNGVTVYHSYKDDDYERSCEYWFNTKQDDDEDTKFDVRDLSNYDSSKLIIDLVKEAIELGYIKTPEDEN